MPTRRKEEGRGSGQTPAEAGKPAVRIKDISREGGQLATLRVEDLMRLPPPFDKPEYDLPIKELTEEQKKNYECSLDGVTALRIRKPKTEAEKEEAVRSFLEGMKKLLSREDNWTFLQPLLLSLENCAKCQTCADACPVYIGSGRNELYRPTYRSEVFRRIFKKYMKPGGKLVAPFAGTDIDLNWETLVRLVELAHRCTLCRRCAQTCPMGVDNALISREIRKLFSQELGINAEEVHRLGSVKQLDTGSSTGLNPAALMDCMGFIKEDFDGRTGLDVELVFDKAGADILLIHNAGEFMSWPENPYAFAAIFQAAGLSWTMASDIVGYDAVNYGLWYDDVQFARVAMKHAQIAKKLGVKKIVVGECGHAHKAIMVIADRVFQGDFNIPRESSMTLLEDLVFSGRLKLDPSRNDFPVTLHDPCNMVRAMGIVEPQRRILRHIAPRFREMSHAGVHNYCCGGGSGFAIMAAMNFPSWRSTISGRMKLKQIIEAFQDVISPEIPKYVCAPCSNCKGQIREVFQDFGVWEKCRINYGGLVELVVNAMTDARPGFIDWEWH